jgi:putative hydrolase of the HAD superfamily
MFRALLLDLDDTLFDRTAAVRALAAELARVQRGRALDREELDLLLELDERGHRDRRDFASDVAARIGLRVDPERFGSQLAEHVTAEPGVRETIEQLAGTLRVGVVTNGGAAQRAKLRRIGLDTIVHEAFVSSEVGLAKPAIGIFAHALAWTGCEPAQVLFVGDHPVVDLAPAASLGMATAWRVRGDWPASLAAPTHRIESIAELRKICR